MDKTKKYVIFNNKKWIFLVIFAGIVTGISLVTYNLIYMGLIVMPLLLYLCIEKPFVFPFGMYAMLLPFTGILVLSDSTKGATITKLLGVITMLVLILKGAFEHKFKRPNSAALWLFAFFVFSVLSILWAKKPSASIKLFPTLTGLMLFYLIVASYKITKIEYETLKWFLLLGGIIASIIAIHSFVTGQYYNEVSNRASLIYNDREINPNTVAFGLLLPIAIGIQLLLNGKNYKVANPILMVMIGIMLFAIIVTGSRKNMLSVIAMILFFVKSSDKKMLSIIVILMIGSVLYKFLPDVFYNRLDTAIESGGSGRIDIWIIGLYALKKYFLYGAGLGNFPHAFQEFVNLSPADVGFFRAAHNIYLTVFVELGIVGFFLLLMFFWKHYQSLNEMFIKHDYNNAMYKGLIAALMVSSFFAEFLFDKSFWMILMMIMMYRTSIDFNSTYMKSITQ